MSPKLMSCCILNQRMSLLVRRDISIQEVTLRHSRPKKRATSSLSTSHSASTALCMRRRQNGVSGVHRIKWSFAYLAREYADNGFL